MKDITKKYSNGEITIVWRPSICIHSKKCWKEPEGLPSVFRPAERPWITPEGAPSDQIIQRVNNCPSGALSYFVNAEGEKGLEEDKKEAETTHEVIAEIVPDGPLLIYGNITIKHADGTETRKTRTTSFCRCGASANRPFCDGAHTKIGFKD